jgi:hypothetical protein
VGEDRNVSRSDQLARRFNVGCLVALLPPAQRVVALRELVEADPGFFRLGYDQPPPVIESALVDGTPVLRQAVARVTRTVEAQERLFALDEPDIDAALADNGSLPYDLARRLRLRRPAVVASGTAYNADHHSRALRSGDAELAAAALLDRRTASWSRPLPPTVWASAWRTVRLAGGGERVRELLAALPADAPLDEATCRIAEASAEPDPEPFLSTAEDRILGTAPFLRRLSAVRERTDRRLAEQILGEPYRVDWSLVSAAGLAGRVPKMAARMLLEHPACPPDVRFVLRNGRPAPPHLKQGSDTADSAGTADVPIEERPHPRPLPYYPSPYAPPPPDAGPLTHGDPLAILATTPVDKDLTIEHVWSAIELKLISAQTAVETVRPAYTMASYAGQTSSFYARTLRPSSGQARLHTAALDYLAHWASTDPTTPGFWRNVNALLRMWPGTLPELLEAAGDGAVRRGR